MNEETQHWNKVFYLCVGVLAAVIIYCTLITFLPIPPANQETARQVLIFFIGTLVGSCLNMLSPGIMQKKSDTGSTVNVTGDSPTVPVNNRSDQTENK